jgi:hypothetical protein
MGGTAIVSLTTGGKVITVGSGIRRPRGLMAVAVALLLLAAGVMATGVTTLLRSTPGGPSFEIGRWLLQLGTVLAGTGCITALLRQAELMRTKRDAWTTLLQDLVVGQDAVEGACLRLLSNANAETYTDLVGRCREMRAMLRRVIALPEADHRSGDLRREAQRMRLQLKPVIHEYERHFTQIARQGLLDDKVLEARLTKLADGPDPGAVPVVPDEFLQPLGVGRLLRDAAKLPALATFLTDFDRAEGEFKTTSEIDDAYESLKAILRKHAGIAKRTGRTPAPMAA